MSVFIVVGDYEEQNDGSTERPSPANMGLKLRILRFKLACLYLYRLVFSYKIKYFGYII